MEELNKIASEGGYDFSKKLEYGESRLLDPLFYQALGKAKGWKSTLTLKHYALRTLEIVLTEGMDKGIEYLKSIVVK